MLSGLNYTKFRFTQGVHMGMAWETIIHTLHPNPNVIISQPYWLHHSKKAHSYGWEVIVPWYPSKLYWLIIFFFCSKNRRNAGPVPPSLLFLRLNLGSQTIQMHINTRQTAFNELYRISSPLSLPTYLQTAVGVELSLWASKSVG